MRDSGVGLRFSFCRNSCLFVRILRIRGILAANLPQGQWRREAEDRETGVDGASFLIFAPLPQGQWRRAGLILIFAPLPQGQWRRAGLILIFAPLVK